jgi:molybdate transport system ATP-binding protein
LKIPRILILDNPLEGVDPENQRILNTVFHSLLKEGIALIFLFQEEKTPDFIQKILYLQEGSGITYTREEWNKREPLQNPASEKSEWKIRGNRSDDYEEESRKILEMENFNLHYGQVQVLKNLNWTVYEGDRWLVFGPNGSGKSTLLSLMNGDHPQAYQESFRWMGRTRGSGESIWDIKKPIGFMSPEMLLHLPHDQNAFQMLASGLMDTLGLFRKLKPEEKERVESLAEFWKLSPHLNRPIRSLSLQDQRILLIARAFIKNPEILILDEPFQGLSPDRISEQKAILEEIFSKSKQTLIFTSHKPSDIPSLIQYRLDLGAGIK